MSKVDKYISALETLGDGRYHYYDGKQNGIGCSDYTKLALVKAGIINNNETFHAASGNVGVLGDTTRFQKIPWDKNNLKRGDIMWSHGHHVATWDGVNGVYEAAPESSHGICDNGSTGVGHWSSHTYYNCGAGSYSWSWLYRIIDNDAEPTQTITRTAGKIEARNMNKEEHINILADYLPIIKKGSTGSYVKCLQVIMKKYGWYAGDIDGMAGDQTVAGIKLLQTALGITVDGSCGANTWKNMLK